MILVDANLLIYARVRTVPHHVRAKAWLDEQFNSGIRVGLPWPSLLAFLRIVTNPKAYERPDTIDSAWKQVEHWLSWPTVWIPEPTDRHPMVLAALLQRLGGGHNLVPDAHLAGIAIEHGLTLCSTDGDFARFAGLKWVNPLV